jgi:hypothetical protein
VSTNDNHHSAQRVFSLGYTTISDNLKATTGNSTVVSAMSDCSLALELRTAVLINSHPGDVASSLYPSAISF